MQKFMVYRIDLEPNMDGSMTITKSEGLKDLSQILDLCKHFIEKTHGVWKVHIDSYNTPNLGALN